MDRRYPVRRELLTLLRDPDADPATRGEAVALALDELKIDRRPGRRPLGALSVVGFCAAHRLNPRNIRFWLAVAALPQEHRDAIRARTISARRALAREHPDVRRARRIKAKLEAARRRQEGHIPVLTCEEERVLGRIDQGSVLVACERGGRVVVYDRLDSTPLWTGTLADAAKRLLGLTYTPAGGHELGAVVLRPSSAASHSANRR